MKNIKIILVFALCALAGLQVSAINPFKKIGGIANSLTSSSKFELESLDGLWHYEAPAVSLKGEGTLSDVSGAAASVAVEEKIKPYYEKLGINTMIMAFQHQDSLSQFEISIRGMIFGGMVSKNDDTGIMTFHFKAVGGIPVGSVSAKAKKGVGNTLSLTFEATGFVQLLTRVASVADANTAKALEAILKTYKEIYVGARLKRAGEASFQEGQ